MEPIKAADSVLSIEHVLPQAWQANWPLPHSAGGDPAQRTRVLHQLGNLTLTTTKLNSSLSHDAWDKKKHSLRKHSLLRLTTGTILTVPDGMTEWDDARWTAEWNEDRIELRTAVLASVALRAWPRA